MHRRDFLLSIPFVACGAAFCGGASAAEAAMMRPANWTGSELTEAERARIMPMLKREGLTALSDVRRKGALIIVVGPQNGTTWRLVIDGQTGAVIGRGAVIEPAAYPR
jgi:hypothetical protein